MGNKSGIEFTKEQREEIIPKLQNFLSEELEIELGGLGARRLLEFVGNTVGQLYYNKAIEDSVSYMNDRVDDLYSLIKE